MKPRQKRIVFVLLGLVGIGFAAMLITKALQSNLSYYYTPTEVVVEKKAPVGKLFRVGGMVRDGSLVRAAGELLVEFIVTDNNSDLKIHYKGILPDLFKEGGGAIAKGRMTDDGIFMAEEVLAKHDADYMPPEVAATMKKYAKDGETMEEGKKAADQSGEMNK
jgi:cytochrome c-type biogenesis protein CcmE